MLCSDDINYIEHQSPYLREEMRFASIDAMRFGVRSEGEYGLFAFDPPSPGPEYEARAIRLIVDPTLPAGKVAINSHFLRETGLAAISRRSWWVRRGVQVVPLREALLEVQLERGEIEEQLRNLRDNQDKLLLNRCLLAARPSLAMEDGRGFDFLTMTPSAAHLSDDTVLVITKETKLRLLVPHRKSGADMVIVIDASKSMDELDYMNNDNQFRSRLEGVRQALNILLQSRSDAGNRIARLAILVFGRNVQMFHPRQPEMVEVQERQLDEIRDQLHILNDGGLGTLNLDRTGTDISASLRNAAALLDSYGEASNEKMVILLSDGAEWTQARDEETEGTIIATSEDAAVLAGILYADSRIRIHTVGIGNEQLVWQRRRDLSFKVRTLLPNRKLLEKISLNTDGIFFDSPDARSLTRLFDELGKGAIYEI
jgi:Mg-chelatase subunit ChlD